MVRESEKAEDRTWGNRDLRKYTRAVCNPFFTCSVWHDWSINLFYISDFARDMGSRHSLYSVHELRYLDATKIQVKMQVGFSFLFWTPWSSMESSLPNFPSYLAKWPTPVCHLFSILMFFQHCDCFQMLYFLQIMDQFLFNHQSLSSLNIWKMVKFLHITVVLLIIQSWKDAAARQLR